MIDYDDFNDKLYDLAVCNVQDQEDGENFYALRPTDVYEYVKELVNEATEYQTHIYKQDHPRLAPKEIWGICIAHKGKTVVGDIASSEEEAKQKLQDWLKKLKEEAKK